MYKFVFGGPIHPKMCLPLWAFLRPAQGVTFTPLGDSTSEDVCPTIAQEDTWSRSDSLSQVPTMASKIIILVLHIFIFSESLPTRAQTLIRAGYWDSGDEFFISDVNSALFTHLMCGFADVNSTSYELSFSPSDEKQFSNFTDAVKKKNPSITTLLSIGGGKNPNYSTYSSMASNPSSRKSFIDSSIKIARLYGFQGLDLSWSWANTSWDNYNIGILFKEWRAAVALEARNNSSQSQLILTARVAYSPYSTIGAYSIDSIRQYLNWVHVITAEYSRPMWTNHTSAPAALYDPNSVFNTEYGITAWTDEGLSADKLVLGLPCYGYAWTLVKPEDNGIGAAATGPALSDIGFVTYKEIKNYIKSYGPNVPVMYNSTYVMNYCSIGKIWFGFDDVEAVRMKVAYAKEKKLRGYFVWKVAYDHDWMLSQAAAKSSKDGANSQAHAGDFNSNDPDLREYSLADIEVATDRFSIENKLGEGGYGPVYKGVLPDGQVIAVKKLSKTSKQGFEEFKNEVMLTAKLQHVNLIRVLGFCIDREEQMLIYEYMPKRSLDYFLFDPIRRFILDWKKRIHIIQGITQGLLYLQEYSRLTIIHRDLKASNVLLDENMKPKISDFGLARIFVKDDLEANTSRIVGTHGYIPPEYVTRGIYSTKSDVYSFGVLLLQIISGRRLFVQSGQNENLSLVQYAYELWKDGKGMGLMDTSLDDTHSSWKLLTCLQIALLCVQENPDDRPSMLEVSSMLENESTADIVTPKKPATFSKQAYEDEQRKATIGLEICSTENRSRSTFSRWNLVPAAAAACPSRLSAAATTCCSRCHLLLLPLSLAAVTYYQLLLLSRCSPAAI
ncbi:Receptor-like serine/threonine-protein kinase [Citrus sinensis]|uniref:Receptor-like serine/threonine-protein kinase n=1 Tax=Citrus sinensis TaxID=2711 RepID=A0ACB8ITN6_CITSI|nr:Receptor-like serine/threonine-protein kinase [Citrus sinensis]